MFGFGKNKTDKQKKPAKKLQAGCEGSNKTESNGQSLAGDALRAQALANARKAREALGDETIQRMVKAMEKMETNPMARARAQLDNVDADRVADEILAMLDKD